MPLKLFPHGVQQWLQMLARISLLLVIIVVSILSFVQMPGISYSGALPLLTQSEKESAQHLATHVRVLAGDIGQRNIWTASSMEASVLYLEMVLTNIGYTVRKQPFISEGGTSLNLEVEIPGTRLPEEIVVVGAHYDSVIDCPGANDNGSGVAAMLELSRLLRDSKPDRTIRFVAFANEEPPFFYTNSMGSSHYARTAKINEDTIIAMFSLETMGYYSDMPKSQQYPAPLSYFYPDTANFIGFVGNIKSRHLVRRSLEVFRKNAQFPSEGLAAPSFVTGVGWSDHWAFWKQGYQAIMVTDTAFYRYAPYHTFLDTPDKVDYNRLSRVVAGLVPTILEIATVTQ